MEQARFSDVDGEQVVACVAAARARAAEFGVHSENPVILGFSSNVAIGLDPHPVVARVGHRVARLWPDGGRARLGMELVLAGWLAEQGASVVAPSDLVPAEVHEQDGRLMTFWELAGPLSQAPSFAEATEQLAELHSVLAGFDGGGLSSLTPVLEYIPMLTGELEASEAVSAEVLNRLRQGFARVSEEIGALNLPTQPLHGDAHLGNLMEGLDGGKPRFIDFEDCCVGPVHWDLASLVGASPKARVSALESYPESIDEEDLAPFVRARTLQGAAWLALRARDDPSARNRSNLMLAELAKADGEAPR